MAQRAEIETGRPLLSFTFAYWPLADRREPQQLALGLRTIEGSWGFGMGSRQGTQWQAWPSLLGS